MCRIASMFHERGYQSSKANWLSNSNNFHSSNVTSIQEEICDETVEVKDNIVEEKVIREVVYVDKETGQEVRRNEVSGSFSCLLLNIFSPSAYHNRRCDSYY